jgi:hypothetical protein
MEDERNAKPDRPNTVAGLVEKRAHLAGMMKYHRAELRKIICDLDHVDATIRLFDPQADVRKVSRYPTKHRATKGEASVFVLKMLKAATAPLTSLDIVRAVIKARGLNADDETVVLMRKRVGATLSAQQRLGFVKSIPQEGRYKGWILVR